MPSSKGPTDNRREAAKERMAQAIREGDDATVTAMIREANATPDRADPERRAEPDWALLDGTLRQRLEYARDQHTLGAQWLDAGYALVPKPASWHRACADWYQQMLDQLDSIETHPERRAEGLDVERLMRAMFEADRPEGWPSWEEYLAAFGHDLTVDDAWRMKAEAIAREYAALTPPPAGNEPSDG